MNVEVDVRRAHARTRAFSAQRVALCAPTYQRADTTQRGPTVRARGERADRCILKHFE
jgi:hypothetical protein